MTASIARRVIVALTRGESYNFMMTKLLEEAFSRAQKLSDTEQDLIARLLIQEIESEKRWDESFARAPNKLRRLADEAWAEHVAGRSEGLDPDHL